jgi:hypothetical protein
LTIAFHVNKVSFVKNPLKICRAIRFCSLAILLAMQAGCAGTKSAGMKIHRDAGLKSSTIDVDLIAYNEKANQGEPTKVTEHVNKNNDYFKTDKNSFRMNFLAEKPHSCFTFRDNSTIETFFVESRPSWMFWKSLFKKADVLSAPWSYSRKGKNNHVIVVANLPTAGPGETVTRVMTFDLSQPTDDPIKVEIKPTGLEKGS